MRNRPKIYAVLCYLSTAAAITLWALTQFGVQSNDVVPPTAIYLRDFLLIAPVLVLAAGYARLILDPSRDSSQRKLAMIGNCCMVAACICYLSFVRKPILATREQTLTVIVIVIVFVLAPIFLGVGALSVFRKYPFRYPLGTIAALVVWPYLAVLARGSLNSYWTDPLSAALLFAVFVSPVPLVFGAAAVRYSPRVGYWAALAGGCMALLGFVWTEIWGSGFRMENSWIALNVSDKISEAYFSMAKLKILASALIVITIVISAFRLMPSRWSFRRAPLSLLTWPAFTICFLALATWYGSAVTPYRVPLIADAVWPEFSVLHVEKHGLQFHEARVSFSRDGRFTVFRNDRRLFQYQFRQTTQLGSGLPAIAYQLITKGTESLQPQVPASWPKPLRAHDAEGWYVLSGASGIRAYTTELGISPPEEIVDLFRNVEARQTTETWEGYERDVCLGFCYDPPAGLGFVYINSRCRNVGRETYCR